jgi:hypothetical protein
LDRLESFEERVTKLHEQAARSPAPEVKYALEPPQIVAILTDEGLNRCLGPILIGVDGHRDYGKAVGHECAVD